MNKFKIGDRVKSLTKYNNIEGIKVGSIGTITDINNLYGYPYKVLFDGTLYDWWVKDDTIQLIDVHEPNEIELIETESKENLVGRVGDESGHLSLSVEDMTANKIHENVLRMFSRANAYAGDKPFPPFEEFIEWYKSDGANMHGIYNYFAQFGVRTVEVPLELGKMYEFSSDKENWEKRLFHGYSTIMGGETKYYPCIRPIQPSRLEQLKSKHPNLSNDEKTELLDILLTQRKEQ
jgi:hypothetical protein